MVLPMEPQRRVWITGGSRGIGRGLVEAFVAAGYRVFTCARREPEAALPSGVHFFCADLRQADEVTAAAAACTSALGGLDLLINNAGGSPMVLAQDASPRFSEAIVKLNLLAPLYCATEAHRIMAQQDGGGTIINVASVSGQRPSPGTAAYGAAKAGLINLTQTLAIEWAPKVRVNAVALGMVHTEQTADHYGGLDAVSRVAATVPLGRLAEAQDLAHLCLFLDSEAASYLTGACIPLHGGGEEPAFLKAAQAVTES